MRPLGPYEIFPEYFDIKEERTSDTQGEGHSITLQPERPSTVGETKAPWDPATETLGGRVAEPVAEAPAAPAAGDTSPRRPGETRRDFNARMARAMNFDSVAEMWERFPELKKESEREQRAEAAEKRRRGPSAPRGKGPRPHGF